MFALPVLAGCQTANIPPVSTDGCRLKLVADLPTRVNGDVILVPALLDGKRAEMQIDVSPSRNYVLKSAAARLKLDSFASTGGEDAVDIHHFQLGKIEIDNLIVTSPEYQIWHPVGSVVNAQSSIGWSGGIGPLLLSRYDVEFDLAAHHIMFFEHNQCAGNVQHWPGPLMTVSYQPHVRVTYFNVPPYEDYSVRLSVTVNGYPATAILSSTSPLQMQRSVADRLGVPSQTMSPKLVVQHGFSRATFYHATVLRVAVDREVLKNVPALINDDSNLQDDADRLIELGTNFLLRNRVYIAYADHTMYFTPFSLMPKNGD